jgi:malonate transporter
MALLIAVENGIIMPFTIMLLDIGRSGPGELWRAPISAAMAILRNPVVMSVLVGAATAVLGVTLPTLLDGLVVLVRGANVPCALFALGATLAGLPLAERLRETGAMVALKLLVYPALVFGIMALLFDVDPAWRAIAVLSAAMPMGANVYVVAARYEVYVARASTAVLLSTIVAVVTVSILAVLLAGSSAAPQLAT